MSAAAPGNADQVEYWNGEVGQRWARNQDRMDRAFQPLTSALVERAAARQGESVIDVGCGCGDLSLALARRLGPDGRVLAVDVSRPMLEQGRSREQALGAGGRAKIDWQEADAAAWRFPVTAFDLLISRFGVMFFADPVAAFQNMRGSLRPGGRLTMLCWRPARDNAWVAIPRAAILQVVPAPEAMPPNAPGPFAFADAAYVGAILAQAGFTAVASVAIDANLDVSSNQGGTDAAALEDAVEFAVGFGPASALLRDVDEPTRERATAAVRDALRQHAGGARPSMGAACWLFTAENPVLGQRP
jgi:ubiquinone/menaquinone biosynthesis C-methylase UbiE